MAFGVGLAVGSAVGLDVDLDVGLTESVTSFGNIFFWELKLIVSSTSVILLATRLHLVTSLISSPSAVSIADPAEF